MGSISFSWINLTNLQTLKCQSDRPLFRSFPSTLTSLSLTNMVLGEFQSCSLRFPPGLKQLHLYDFDDITDEHLTSPFLSKLEVLVLDRCSITERIIKTLLQMKKLQQVSVNCDGVSVGALKALPKHVLVYLHNKRRK